MWHPAPTQSWLRSEQRKLYARSWDPLTSRQHRWRARCVSKGARRVRKGASGNHLAQARPGAGRPPNGNIAREVNHLLGRTGPFWSRRYKAIPIGHDAKIQEARLKYLFQNGPKEGLVWSPRKWPGVHCAEALITGKPMHGIWYDRTAMFEARRCGEKPRKYDYATKETLRLDPLPCWRELSDEERREKAKQMVREVEEETREQHQRAGTTPMGVKAILRQDPRATPAHSDRSPAPRFHTSCWEDWVSLKESYRLFRIAFRQASAELRAGRVGVQFPVGSFPPGMPFVRGSPELALP